MSEERSATVGTPPGDERRHTPEWDEALAAEPTPDSGPYRGPNRHVAGRTPRRPAFSGTPAAGDGSEPPARRSANPRGDGTRGASRREEPRRDQQREGRVPVAATAGAGAVGAAGATRAAPAAPTPAGAPGAAKPTAAAGAPAPPEATAPTAAVPSGESPAASPARGAGRSRRARLVLTRVDPWSVMKLSFLLSLALGVIFITAVALLWSMLDGLGVFDQIARTAGDLTRGETGGGLNVESYLALRRVLGATTILSVINVLLLTALATLGAFLYNLACSLVGGLQVTLTEDA